MISTSIGMKIPDSEQVRQVDTYTIENEPIASIGLMERAAGQLFRLWIRHFTNDMPVFVFAGPGNNGGDGIALARMLAEKNYRVHLYILKGTRGLSPDAETNFKRLPDNDNLKLEWLNENELDRIVINPGSIIADALFGSGLTRSLDGFPAKVVRRINSLNNIKVAIDIPSGLFAENNPDTDQITVKADYTWCFQFPKLSFLMPENEKFVGKWTYLDIGLHQEFINDLQTPYFYITKDYAGSLIHVRDRFSHKGTYGHALLYAGAEGKIGAAILASRSCLRSGVGLLTAHVPVLGMNALHSAVPEAMLSPDEEKNLSKLIPHDPYSAIGAGPGIGTGKETSGLIDELTESKVPMVLDADALNILSERKYLIEKLPHGTILTPHPGEYVRLFGKDENHFMRLSRMQEISSNLGIIIVLKGANTAIATPDGKLWFNSTGNPGMATAGSGDVLTGIILSLLAQAYAPVEAAVLGVFIHGLAGDLAASEKGYEGLIASDIIESIPAAFKSCNKIKNKLKKV